MKKRYIRLISFPVAGCILLLVPLLRDFHIESAILAGIFGCFWAGVHSSKHSTRQDFFPALRLLGYLYLAGLPIFIYSLITGCLTFDGAGFWLLIPLPSVFFGAAVGRLLRKTWVPFSTTITVLVLLFCSLGLLFWELLNFPQVYFFNHVWGYWPGPIYDETIQLTGSFLFFRWITFLWIVLLWVLPEWSKNLQTKLITGFTLFGLIFSYLNLGEMGIISPRQQIQKQLKGHSQTKHFNLYYNADFFSPQEVEYWAKRHEFNFQQITEQLDVVWPENRRVESYLYAHAWEKKKLVGAKFTSYVPVWLDQDQLHIAKQQLDPVLKHELVHVISKQFGNRLFNASWSVGLIEGIAEAIAGDASSQSTLDQIVASEKPYPNPEELKSSLSASGFYGSASAISYTTTGSFVKFLLENYPVELFKKAYPKGSFEENYPESFEVLVQKWQQHLDSTKIDSVDKRISEFIFAQRSLFEKTCPHAITQEMKLWDKYQFLLADHDTLAANKTLDELHELNPRNDLVLSEWVTVQLRNGNYDRAVSAFTPEDTLLTLQAIKADAFMLNGQSAKADSLLKSIAPAIRASSVRNFRYSLALREDSTLWNYHVERRYKNRLPDYTAFERLNLPNKMLSVNKALELNSDQKLVQYSSLLLDDDVHEDWFDIHESQIDRLVFIGEFELADKWLLKLSAIELRARYSERLQELKEWRSFLKK